MKRACPIRWIGCGYVTNISRRQFRHPAVIVELACDSGFASSMRPGSRGLNCFVPPSGILKPADNWYPLLDGRATGAIILTQPTAQKQKTRRSEALGEHTGRYSEGFGQSRQRSSYAWFTQTGCRYPLCKRPGLERAIKAPGATST